RIGFPRGERRVARGGQAGVGLSVRPPVLTNDSGRRLLVGRSGDSFLQSRPHRRDELEVRLRKQPLVERADLGVRPTREPPADPLVESARTILAQRDRLLEIVNFVPHSSPPTR